MTQGCTTTATTADSTLPGGWFPMPRAVVSLLAQAGPAATVVWLVLAARADGAGVAWPSISRLIRDARQTKRITLRAIKRLEQLGLIIIERAKDDHGRKAVNRYTLPPLRDSDKREPVQVPKCNAIGSRLVFDSDKREPGTTNSKQPTENNKKARRKAATLEYAIPLELDNERFKASWAEWLAYKREKRQSLTSRTAAAQLKMLAGLGTDGAVAAIDQSIQAGWSGIFPLKESTHGHGPHRHSRTHAAGAGQRHPDDIHAEEGRI